MAITGVDTRQLKLLHELLERDPLSRFWWKQRHRDGGGLMGIWA